MQKAQEESARVESLLDEIENTQQQIEACLLTGQTTEADLERLQEVMSRIDHYIPIVKRLAGDVVSICERSDALRKRVINLASKMKI
ncbi:unnamed protein product, partial [Mesorhabditis belari]|uniref:Uncharacterized protein n=1 Tax=Mesorhabditis belari TaxID=2138241 RepID=A0AAF3F2Z8_9BILA